MKVKKLERCLASAWAPGLTKDLISTDETGVRSNPDVEQFEYGVQAMVSLIPHVYKGAERLLLLVEYKLNRKSEP